jgi:hypothetical protein
MASHSTEGYHAARYRIAYAADPSNYLTAAVEARALYYDLDQQRFTVREESVPYVMSGRGDALQALGFVNWNWRPVEELSFNIGVNAQYMGLNGTSSIEPRAAGSWSFTPTQSINLGFGVHRQPQSLVVYEGNPANHDLDFTQALHYVLGYSNQLASDLLVKVEGYYKDISHAPVDRDSATGYSLLNAGTNFGSAGTSRALTSTGLGRTYGVELSLFKHFTEGYYVTATGSFFRQEYAGSDGVWRFGAFDNRYVVNLLAGYEWRVSPSFTMEFGGKYTTAGGAPYTPVDPAKSRLYGTTYTDPSVPYSLRNRAYGKLDLRVDFRKNYGSWSLISYVSVENVLNTKNVETWQYDPLYDRVEEVDQLGIFPVGGVRAEF